MESAAPDPRPTSANALAAAHPHPPLIPDHELLRRIGQGAYGEVWLARNVMGTLRAVKVLYRDAFADARPYEREFQGIQKFEPISRTHEGLVDVLQIGLNESAGYFYYVMELADAAEPQVESECELRVEGSARMDSISQPMREDRVEGSLSQLSTQASLNSYSPRTLASDLKSQGRLPYAQCLRMGLALADALEHLHRHGLIHRDIKPSNIIFVNGAPKLADIGLVAAQGAGKSWVGTEGFMPPEGPGTPQADVFSLGKVLYEISTGKDRQRFPEPLTALGDLPDQADWLEFNEVVEKACQGDPQRRYASAADLRADLALLWGGKSVRRLRRMERVWARAKYTALAAGILAVFAVTWFCFQSRMIRQVRQRLLIEQMQVMRNAPRTTNWFSTIWATALEAARLGPNEDVRAHAAAALAGLDGSLLWRREKISASAVAFAPDGQRLLVGGLTNAAGVWDFRHSNYRLSQRFGMGPVGFSREGRPLQFIRTIGLNTMLWDVSADQVVREFSVPPRYEPAPPTQSFGPVLAMTPDGGMVGMLVVSAARKTNVFLWSGTTGQMIHQFDISATALAFSPDGSLFAAGEEMGEVSVWRLPSCELVARLRGERLRVEALAFGRNPRAPVREPNSATQWLLASGDAGGSVSLWDLARLSKRGSYRGNEDKISAIGINADGTLIAVGAGGLMCLWDVAGERIVLRLSNIRVSGLAFFADREEMLAISARTMFGPGAAQVLRLENGRGIQSLRGLRGRVWDMCFSPDGRLVAARTEDWLVGVWEHATARLLHVFEAPPGATPDNAALLFSPDSRFLAFASAGGARLWDVGDGSEAKAWDLSPGIQEQLAFHESGKLLLFQAETKERTQWPFTGNDVRKHPIVCRIRNLFQADPNADMVEITNFTGRVIEAVMAPDGKWVFVQGYAVEDENLHKEVGAFDPISARRLFWERVVWLNAGGNFYMAPSLRFLNLIRSSMNDVVRVRTSPFEIVGPVNDAQDLLDPEAEISTRFVPGVPRRGFHVFRKGNGEASLTLGIDQINTTAIRSDSKGQFIAWSSGDGTVLVANLKEVEQRLAELEQ